MAITSTSFLNSDNEWFLPSTPGRSVKVGAGSPILIFWPWPPPTWAKPSRTTPLSNTDIAERIMYLLLVRNRENQTSFLLQRFPDGLVELRRAGVHVRGEAVDDRAVAA